MLLELLSGKDVAADAGLVGANIHGDVVANVEMVRLGKVGASCTAGEIIAGE